MNCFLQLSSLIQYVFYILTHSFFFTECLLQTNWLLTIMNQLYLLASLPFIVLPHLNTDVITFWIDFPSFLLHIISLILPSSVNFHSFNSIHLNIYIFWKIDYIFVFTTSLYNFFVHIIIHLNSVFQSQYTFFVQKPLFLTFRFIRLLYTTHFIIDFYISKH